MALCLAPIWVHNLSVFAEEVVKDEGLAITSHALRRAVSSQIAE